MATGQDLRDPRRALRLPARCAVTVRHRFRRWRAESEDLGPEGCQLVTPRLVAAGRQVRLTIELPGARRSIAGRATVIWSRVAQPSRLGLRFQRGAWDRGWFDAIVSADPALASAAGRRPATLPWRAPLHLGTPPQLIVDFTRDELAVLQRLRPGMKVVDLVATFGKAPDRLVGALFALVARRQIVLNAAASPGPAAWADVLAGAQALEAADGLAPELHLAPARAAGGRRVPDVQHLLAEAREHLAAGRISLAAERFREARALAPDDKDARAEVRKMGRFG